MAFVHPEWLWFLPMALLPLILHLIHFRRYRKVLFPNVQVIESIREEERVKNRLRQWLMLASRMLFLAALVLLFAQPTPNKEAQAGQVGRSWLIYLDQSFSMEAEGSEGLLGDQAIQALRMLLGQLNETDKVQLITNELLPEDQRMRSLPEARERLTQGFSGGQSPSMEALLQRQAQAETPAEVLWLTDLQKSAFAFPSQWPEGFPELRIWPFQSGQAANLSIDSVWFDRPALLAGQTASLSVQLTNHSADQRIDVPVYLRLDGDLKPPVSISLDPMAKATAQFSFLLPEAGWHDAEVYTQDRQMPFDNNYFLAFEVAKSIRILEVYGPEAQGSLQKLFGKDSLFQYQRSPERSLEVDALAASDLVVLHALTELPGGLKQALDRHLEAGGSVLVVPGSPESLVELNAWRNLGWRYGAPFAQAGRMALPQSNNPFFKDVFDRVDPDMDLPEIAPAYELQRVGEGLNQVPISWVNGSPMLAGHRGDFSGKVWLMACPITDFSKHALFVPVMLNIALSAAPASIQTKVLGEDLPFAFVKDPSLQDPVYRIEPWRFEGDSWIAFRQSVAGKDQVRMARVEPRAGFYRFLRGQEEVLRLGVNYDRRESNPQLWDLADFEKEIQAQGLQGNISLIQATDMQSGGALVAATADPKWWRWLVLLALLALALEILWMKLWP